MVSRFPDSAAGNGREALPHQVALQIGGRRWVFGRDLGPVAAELSGSAFIADRQEDVARLLAKRNQESTHLQRAKADAECAKKSRQTLEKRHDELALQRTELQSVRDEKAHDLQRTLAELAVLDAPLLEAKDANLRRLLDGTRLSDRFTRASATLARAVQEAETAAKECEASQADITTAERALQEAHTQFAELEPLHELAEGSISKEAIQLRSVLIEGEPCPVCGSAEHRKSSSLDHLHALADQLRQRRDAFQLVRLRRVRFLILPPSR